MRKLVILAALTLCGCSTVSSLNQGMLDQAQPTIVRIEATGERFIWLRGLVPTVMLRAKELDAAKADPVK